ncbi:PAS domain-containing protein [Neptuniibacter halophilus]|uniref:PAS domain-containing protein n=1 Tax=Neptuniibacter halophilus TaxID=651666 RepID=UPI0025729B39|nr:PAS domain-containing protein [Neptuniibacter halophilus]
MINNASKPYVARDYRIPELLALFVALISAAVFIWLDRHQTEAALGNFSYEEHKIMEQQIGRLGQHFEHVSNALDALAEQLRTDPGTEVLEANWVTLMRANPEFYQLRWINPEGQELLKGVNQQNKIRLEPADQLQDKSQRDYFRAMQALQPGATYISPMELNKEFGKIETPHRPVVRIAKRISPRHGYLIINLDLESLILQISNQYRDRADSWLINGDGDWLVAPESQLEWGFMLGQRHTISEYFPPRISSAILQQEPYSVRLPDGRLLLSLPLSLSPEQAISGGLIYLRRFNAEYVERILSSGRIAPLYSLLFLAALIPLIFLIIYRQGLSYQQLSSRHHQQARELGRLENLANFLPQLTWTCTPEGECDFISESWANYTGAHKDYLLGSGWLDYIHPDDRKHLIDSWSHSIATGEDFYCRFRIRNAEQEYRTFANRATALRDEQGQIQKWFGSNTDIQDRISYEQELEQHKQALEQDLAQTNSELQNTLHRLQLASESTGLGIWEYDLEQGSLIWDPRMFELYGVDPAKASNDYHQWADALHPEDQARAIEDLNEALSHSRPFNSEFRIVHPTLGVRWIKANALLEIEDNKIIKMVGANRDITAEKNLTQKLEKLNLELEQEAENARASAESKARFLANMSHEIRTPMNGVMGMLALLKDSRLNSQQKVYADKAFFAAERLLGILNDILDLSRMDSGKLSLNIGPCSVDKLIQDSVELFTITAEQKNIKLLVDIDPDTPLQLMADTLRLSQILSNLVGNAVKFTPAGGHVWVSFRASRLDSEHCSLIAEVRDDGIGLSEEMQAKLFQEFSQADETMTRGHGGTGLGLAICKRLSDLMHGSLIAESTPGEGTLFRLTVPLRLAEQNSALRHGNLSDIHLVLLSEVPSTRAMLQAHVPHWRVRLSTVDNIRSALEVIRESQQEQQRVILLVEEKAEEVTTLLAQQPDNTAILKQAQRCIFISPSIDSSIKTRLSEEGFELQENPLNPSKVYQTLKSLAEQDKPEEPDQTPQSQMIFPGLRILSVDDVAMNRDVVEGLLTPLQVELTQVASGTDAIALCRDQEFDLILMDVHMEDMTGLDATRLIRALKIKQPVILGLSASVLDEDRRAALQAGMNGYLTKPFILREFTDEITRHGITGEEYTQPGDTPEAFSPELPAFIDQRDVEAKMAGDFQLLNRCIHSYLNSFDAFADDYRQAIEAGDLQQCKALMHKLRGASANLSDIELSRLAAAQETAHHNGQLADSEAALHCFETHYQSLRQWSRQQPTGEKTDQEQLSAEAFDELFERIVQLLSHSQYVSHEDRQLLLDEIRRRGLCSETEELEQAFNTFNYEAAATLLNAVRKSDG